MSSEVKIWKTDFMESQNDNESLRARIREIEDENQELRTQNLMQNRTINELRNEMIAMRLRLNEMTDTSNLLRERVRNLSQNVPQQENDGSVGQITVPPIMAPPPVPPPLPSARIRISPRQVGAGEALTTPLGVSLSSPPRHRVKRDYRQGYYRSTRPPFHRAETMEPGPSTPVPLLPAERPNYFVGLRIIPQFHTSFVCAQNQSSGYSDSASDSSGSDENTQLIKKPKWKLSDVETAVKKQSSPYSEEFELVKNVRNMHHQKVRQAILHNYNLSFQNTNSKFFYPLPWNRKNRENPQLPSTSSFPRSTNAGSSGRVQSTENGLRTAPKISDCVQYTFPTIHEGIHQNGIPSVFTGHPSRLRKLKKNIPYTTPEGVKNFTENKKEHEEDASKPKDKSEKTEEKGSNGIDSESLSSTEEAGGLRTTQGIQLDTISSDLDQDGIQGDESSNCITSNENSLEKICVSDLNMKKKN